MKPQTHLAIDGYVDQIPAPGTGWGTARFDLVHSPVDAGRITPDTPDTVYACPTEDPNLAAALLNEIQPGDLLRVTGTLTQPDNPDAPALPPAATPTNPWASSYPIPVDRSSLAWCTAAQMLANHHHTGIYRQVLAADALLRELGMRGLQPQYFAEERMKELEELLAEGIEDKAPPRLVTWLRRLEPHL